MAKERHREKERKRDRKGETLNHLSIHQWVLSAIFASHQLTSPKGFPFFETSATTLCGTTGTLISWSNMKLQELPVWHCLTLGLNLETCQVQGGTGLDVLASRPQSLILQPMSAGYFLAMLLPLIQHSLTFVGRPTLPFYVPFGRRPQPYKVRHIVYIHITYRSHIDHI